MSSLIEKKMIYSTLVSFCLVVLVSASSSEPRRSEKYNWLYGIAGIAGILVLVVVIGSCICCYKEKRNRNNEADCEAEGLQTSRESARRQDTFKVENANCEAEGLQTSRESARRQDTFKVENEKNTSEIDHLKEEIHQLKKENENLNTKLCSVEGWRRACEDTDTITLDADSAHPCIFIENRSFTHRTEILPVQLNPQRFDGIVAVLGIEGFSSGNHYWQVDIGNSNDWDVGVARKSIKRNGNITLSPKEGFWVLGFTGRDYFAKTDPWTRITVQRKPEKIGVHLCFQENKVTFFNVTDFSILFEFKACEFSEEIYPFFKNGDKGKTMHILPRLRAALIK